MTGLSDPRHCDSLLFYRGCTDFSLFSVSIHRRHRRVGYDLCFHGLSSGGAFSTRRTTTSAPQRIANVFSLQLDDCICLEIEMLQRSDITQLVAHASGVSYQS